MKNNPEAVPDAHNAVKEALAAALVFAEVTHPVTLEGATSRPFPVESDGPGQTIALSHDAEMQAQSTPVSEELFDRAASAHPGEVVAGGEQAAVFVGQVGALLQDFRTQPLTRGEVDLAA